MGRKISLVIGCITLFLGLVYALAPRPPATITSPLAAPPMSVSLPVSTAQSNPEFTALPLAKAKLVTQGTRTHELIILDGSESTPQSGELTYVWRQTGGFDLRLRPATLSQARFGIRFNRIGEYKFSLTVISNGIESAPANVEFTVTE